MQAKRSIIFMDGEFATLKADGIDLLSIGLIREDGEELYLEIEFDGKVDPWVEEHVLPTLSGNTVTKAEAVKKIKKFVGNDKPLMVAYVNEFDWMGVCKLFDANNSKDIITKVPFFVIPIDLASVLYAYGIEPGLSLEEVAKAFGISTSRFTAHHALDDARLARDIYAHLRKGSQKV